MSNFDRFADEVVYGARNASSEAEVETLRNALAMLLEDKIDEYQKWSAEVMSVLLGWAMHFVEEVLGEDASKEDVLAAYPMKQFKALYDKGVELGLLREGDSDAERS